AGECSLCQKIQFTASLSVAKDRSMSPPKKTPNRVTGTIAITSNTHDTHESHAVQGKISSLVTMRLAYDFRPGGQRDAVFISEEFDETTRRGTVGIVVFRIGHAANRGC